ncbi:aminoglycoside phosphotransferase family protein [Occultella glacieicola]|uniref:Aminoglycoside phosphotransferase family protein n=1 Tax=Occultella glacieicola TaxID=2518684 RepID=A0ABY2EA16_9MICO|nr:aminoglycoside phosphotransferase family protein [Occultella glacieicola]
MPRAEVEVTTDLARRLLTDQFPELATTLLRTVANGWDNVMIRAGEHFVIRLPRRQAAADLVRHEQLALPTIRDLVRVTVPTPRLSGEPTDYYPWHWSVLRWLPGHPATGQAVAARRYWAGVLGDFLADLHVPAPDWAPLNPVRGVPLATREAAVTRRLRSGHVPRGEELLALWRRLLPAPVHTGPPVWVHGDLHPLNLLVDRGRLSAVVDFGDVTAGDPATDLATAWLTFDAPGRAEFVVRYAQRTGVGDAVWARARGWALVLASAIAEASDDHPELASIGAHGIAELLDAPDAHL